MSEERDTTREYEELVSFIAQALLGSDDFVVSSSTKDGAVVIKLAAPEGKRGRIIGKGGRIARAFRTVVEAAAIDPALKPTLDIVD